MGDELRRLIEQMTAAELDAVVDLVTERRHVLAKTMRRSLTVGDRVRFRDSVRPSDLRGQYATVVDFGKSRVVVRLERGFGRWSGEVRTPGSCLERA